jgi:hypothetical protein
MRPNTVFLAGGVLGVVFGLGFLLIPGIVLPLYGPPPEPTAILMSRFFGVALFHLGLLLYLLREVREPGLQRLIATAGVAGSVAGLAVALMAVLGGLVNSLGWSTVLIYALLLLGYLSCMRARAAVV